MGALDWPAPRFSPSFCGLNVKGPEGWVRLPRPAAGSRPGSGAGRHPGRHGVISGIFSEAMDVGDTENNFGYGLLKEILPSNPRRNRSEPDACQRQDLWGGKPKQKAQPLRITP
jgi:hypothetical protein